MAIEVTDTDFEQKVIERSRELPVVVDFWAAWCAPCRMLQPVLDRAVASRAGKVELAKLNVDQSPMTAAQYGIQGIPAVKGFRDGRVAAEFVGAQPAPAVERFLDQLVPSESEELAERGDEESLRRALQLDPRNAKAAAALGRLLHERDDDDEALEVLERVPGDFTAEGLAARIRLERAGLDGLAEAFAALDAGDAPAALERLIAAIPSADGHKDEIRRVVVGVLQELDADEARDWRRRLAAALY